MAAGHEEILLRSVQVCLEAGLDEACRVDGEGGQPRRAVFLLERGSDHGSYSGATADFPDAVQPPVGRTQPLPRPLQQVQPVPRQGELRKDDQPGSVRLGIFDQPYVLWHVGGNAAVQGLVLDGGQRQCGD